MGSTVQLYMVSCELALAGTAYVWIKYCSMSYMHQQLYKIQNEYSWKSLKTSEPKVTNNGESSRYVLAWYSLSILAWLFSRILLA